MLIKSNATPAPATATTNNYHYCYYDDDNDWPCVSRYVTPVIRNSSARSNDLWNIQSRWWGSSPSIATVSETHTTSRQWTNESVDSMLVVTCPGRHNQLTCPLPRPSLPTHLSRPSLSTHLSTTQAITSNSPVQAVTFNSPVQAVTFNSPVQATNWHQVQRDLCHTRHAHLTTYSPAASLQ